jgi:OFA family oxalate/formate antiporter-like MFS transporter
LKKNRWLIALSAIAIHLSIGSVYAYSVFKKPLQEALGWTSQNVSVAFMLAIFFLGISAAFFGKFVEKYGPRKSALVAAVLFAGGLLGTGFTIQNDMLYGFYATYGVIGGIGLGIGYISPVSTLVKWFPDRRGLATGMAVLGFGAGALIAGPVAESLMGTIGIPGTFYTLGIVYFILMAAGALYIAKPPEDYMADFKDDKTTGRRVQDLAQLTANEAIKTPRFWFLWWMMFINIAAGIMLISVASPMAQDKVGMTEVAAATMVGLMGLFNGGGRLLWASASDYIGRANIYIIFFAIQLILFLLLPNVSNAVMFQIAIFIIVSIYGGGFASLPAFIGDLFGTKQLGAIHGYLLTAWALAGVAGPTVVEYVRAATNSYNGTFYIFATLIGSALAVSFIMRFNIRNVKKQMKMATE